MQQAIEVDEQRVLDGVAAKVAGERYAPHDEEWDRARTAFPKEKHRYLGELGFLGIALPGACGGGGAPLQQALGAIEELAKECRPAAFQVFESNTGPAQMVARFGTEQQRERFLPSIIGGETPLAVAISEPGAGSAATDLKTKATRSGDSVVVNGGKRWISNGGEADHYLVYARMSDEPGSKGIGAVLVEADRDGVSFGQHEKLMGFRGTPSADVLFDAVVVPAENIVVGPGRFRELFGAFSIERLGNATMSLAVGQAALDRAKRYVQCTGTRTAGHWPVVLRACSAFASSPNSSDGRSISAADPRDQRQTSLTIRGKDSS